MLLTINKTYHKQQNPAIAGVLISVKVEGIGPSLHPSKGRILPLYYTLIVPQNGVAPITFGVSIRRSTIELLRLCGECQNRTDDLLVANELHYRCANSPECCDGIEPTRVNFAGRCVSPSPTACTQSWSRTKPSCV